MKTTFIPARNSLPLGIICFGLSRYPLFLPRKDSPLNSTAKAYLVFRTPLYRVSIRGVKSHFACFCQGFDFYEVKKKIKSFVFQKEN